MTSLFGNITDLPATRPPLPHASNSQAGGITVGAADSVGAEVTFIEIYKPVLIIIKEEVPAITINKIIMHRTTCKNCLKTWYLDTF